MLPLTGVGLRAPHIQQWLTEKPATGFIEAHTENFLSGAARVALLKLAETYPVSLHGVGLSLGRADGLNAEHLAQVARLVRAVQPVFVSEHLSWSAYQHVHVPDLLPLPFTREAFGLIAAHIDQWQESLQRTILLENPSNYLAFAACDYDEPSFLNDLATRTGCRLLLDVNNIAVSAHNLGSNAAVYLDAINPAFVAQIHLAGYQSNTLPDGSTVLIDTHGQPVHAPVWELYAHALRRFGDVPTLIEWDTDIPPLSTLLSEAAKADAVRALARRPHDRAA